ncbi:TetR/AcrR family transcriptional regulator [Streptomyces sp. DSM 40712]|uniref:TetR/AcrR family transcriptional regulator n=1 Tax=Streptomyces lancefieldiae TaxID=3075520 RepID=A0ABU3ATM4_9ACTN|nr:TetR/AcrR family transcriptional regulator [Streptomyces sp. DSM 40712]MDT0612181.1 TetR/AcrR family transcriptional regulator [Streptomyces sp. DSM 40712]
MTNSVNRRAQASQKRQRLTAAAARVLHQQGVERTTLGDIAREADVPVGNVYYYFKTKDELIQAALSEHSAHLDELTGRLEQLADPRDRLKALIEAWVDQRDVAARYGCPTGTLAVELDKRADGTLDTEAGAVIRRLLDWSGRQFRELGLSDPDDLALTLISAYQGMSLLANALRDPDIMTREGSRLLRWLDSLRAPDAHL